MGTGVRSASGVWLHQALKSLKARLKTRRQVSFRKGKPAEILLISQRKTVQAKSSIPEPTIRWTRYVKPWKKLSMRSAYEVESFTLPERTLGSQNHRQALQVFTPYWRNCRNGISQNPPITRSEAYHLQISLPHALLEELGLLPAHPWCENSFALTPGGGGRQAQVAHRREIVIRTLTSETLGTM